MLRRLAWNYLLVFGLPTLVTLVGFFVGKNYWFNPHSYGWPLLLLSLLFSVAAQLMRIARSETKSLAVLDGAISLVAFALIFVALFALMPNYWPDWS